ncbi:MAG: sel1 repeat family protein, partial [Verrucomicrobia bacterium]|nr:sel1 repeat family protein [Verrucomicrobiota bacterium]
AAAGQGLAAAQHNLGVMFAEGDGVPRDRAEAVKWFRRAAEQGHAAAQCNLGAMYYAGEGVPRDCVEACEWYALAVQGGVVVAEDGCRDLALEMSAGQMVEALRRCREFQPVKPGP